MKIIKLINKVINPYGAQLTRYPYSDIKRRIKLLDHFKINKIFDVGANVGEYVMTLRKLGFDGEIISFEPLTKTYNILKQNSQNDKRWLALNIALGVRDENSIINIAGNTDSSSILEMLPSHLKSAPHTKYIGKEKIMVKSLDSIFNEYYNKDDNIYIKIDTQGFEKNVIKGATKSLSIIKGIQIEMSLIQLYKGGILYLEMIDLLKDFGFDLYSVENGFFDPNSGQLLQVDGIFFRN
jgi:FkbM family methyltransferase